MAERRPIIAGNWKMFKTIAETRSFFSTLVPLVRGVDHCDIVVAPPFTTLAVAAEAAKGSNIAIAAQDTHWEENGAFTGEVSVRMIADTGCTYVIVGHSERRQFFGETDDSVEAKTKGVIRGRLKAIVCVGETLAERDAGKAYDVVARQTLHGLGRLTPPDLSHIIVAYEPVWAIGTGRAATPQIAAEMHGKIRETFAGIFGAAEAAALRILYGGSVKPDNISALMRERDIDGALVGGASLDATSFASIVKYQK
jgi:triosephosphate isomerase